MDKQQLQAYLSSEYQGEESFLETIIFPIFGEENYETAWQLPVLEDEDLQGLATRTGIKDIIKYGTISIGHVTIDIFDVTVSDSVQMQRNRVGIQQLIRRIMNTYSSAFIIFHYKDNWQLDWRFSFCQKDDKNITEAKRYTFLLGPGQSCRTAAENFIKLLDKNGNVQRDDIVKAFDVEALSKEFFDKYKVHYDRFCTYVYDNKENTDLFGEAFAEWEDKTIRDYVKKLLGRIVFLHFLQKKGWMGVPADKPWGEGDRQFMKTLFDKATDKQKANYLDEVLEPLFSEALDVDRRANNDLFDCRVEGFRNVKIPYLNGGLFEREKLDEPKSTFSRELFADFLEFLYQYNFTIDENDPNDAEVGVDPEMLGRIFENLLEDNKDKGAFYTPKEIVQYMCKESLIAYLQTDVESEDMLQRLREFVRTYDVELIGGADCQTAKDVDEYLKAVKICDPAIGSGAFPMGLMKELYLCRSAIEGFDGKRAAEIKKHIIQENIYGVDIEKGAVDIARLRFWLSLILDEETPHALPNLDFKIMQGNSLLEQYEGVELSGMSLDEQKKRKTKKGDYYQTSFAFDEKFALENIQKAIKQYYLTDNHETKVNLRKTIDDNVKSYILNLKGCTPDIQRKLENLPIPNDQFFLWHIYFKEVFDKGGFDIVIGNPPYGLINKRQNQGDGVVVPEKILDIYKSSTEFVPAKGGMLNIFRLFVVHGGTLLKTNGIFCEIFPLAFTCDLSSAKLRQHVINNYNILNIEAFPERDNPLKRVFASAKMSVCILTFANKRNDGKPFALRINREPFVEEYKVKSYYTTSQIISIDSKNYTIPLTETSDANLLVKIYSHSFPFGNVGKCYTGEIDMTFCKKAFTANPADAKMLRGAHVDRYVVRNEISQGEIYYLDTEILSSVKKSLNKEIFSSPRIIMQGITGVNEKTRLKMTLVKDTFCANSVNYCLFNDLEEARFMLALFNSKTLNYVFKLLSTNSNVNGYEVDNLPIPKTISNTTKVNLSNLVDSVLRAKESNVLADTSDEEREIDRIVYDLYGLTEDEIKIVEGTNE